MRFKGKCLKEMVTRGLILREGKMLKLRRKGRIVSGLPGISGRGDLTIGYVIPGKGVALVGPESAELQKGLRIEQEHITFVGGPGWTEIPRSSCRPGRNLSRSC